MLERSRLEASPIVLSPESRFLPARGVEVLERKFFSIEVTHPHRPSVDGTIRRGAGGLQDMPDEPASITARSALARIYSEMDDQLADGREYLAGPIPSRTLRSEWRSFSLCVWARQ
jgi:glutathione S-transferase